MNSSQKSERQHYIQLFSVEKVERACRKANWHRARAVKLGRAKHFSAWEWLDLCESHAWNCAYCAQNGPLEPHHVQELHRGGENCIENIEALCHECHAHIHEWPDDVSEAWMRWQNQLLTHFQAWAHRGEGVRLSCGTREQNELRRRGVLMEFLAPQPGRVPLRGILPRDDRKNEPFVSLHRLNADWWAGRARARVQWHAGGMWEETVPLAHLARREREKEAMAAKPMLKRRPVSAAVQFSLGF